MTLSKSPSNSQNQSSQTASQRTLKAFALEPILTPSGIVDAPDGINDVDDIELPSYVNDDADLDIETQDESTYSSDVNDNEFEVIPFADVDIELSPFESGVFTVGESGEVSIDFLFDSGDYQGEVAIFSLEGMEEFEPGSPDFIYEVASRAVSNSELGYVVISDVSEGARFSGSLGEGNFNSGDYQGVKTFAMKPGDEFGIMLVPDSTVEQLVENPTLEGSYRPLFSMATANPDDAFHAGQIVDVTGDGNTFVFEDMRVDGGSDRDYNDVVFQVRGASGEAALMDDLVAEGHDWRDSNLGKAIVEYAKPYIEAPDLVSDIDYPTSPTEDQPLIGIIDTGFAANNPDLNYDNITLGSDRVDGDDNPLLTEGEGNEHGTHILGIIAAEQDNGIGIDGINDDAPIWVGRTVGSGEWADSLVEFVEHFRETDQPNAVVNLSLDLTQVNPDGSVTTRYELTPAERAAIDYARQHNIILVVGAGNDGDVMSALGQASQEFDNIITIGSANRVNDDISLSTGLDRSDYSSYGYGLDLMAPGGTSDNPKLSLTDNSVGEMAGTSVATAKVTGAVSQVWASNPDLSYRQVIEILKNTATDLGASNWDSETGAGLLSTAAAISIARITTPQDYDTPATLIPETWDGDGLVTPGERAIATPFMGRYYEWDRYTIRRGDTLSGIAQRTMGNGSSAYWNFIYNRNRGTIANPSLIYPGQVIWVPRQVAAPRPTPTPTPTPTPQPTPTPAPIPNVPINPNSPNYRNGQRNPYAYNPALIGQCTWYTYGRMQETGLMPPGAISGALFRSHAYKWENDARSLGLPVTSTPIPGARGIVVWPPGVQGGHSLYGHVAFLEEVLPDGRIRISQSNWAGNKSPHERILTPVQYAGLKFVQLEDVRTTNPTAPLPGNPGNSRQYVVRPGDTLWGIAQRHLGNGNRWREIMKTPNGGTFTDAEARRLRAGQSVYLPVTYQAGTGNPVNPRPQPSPGTIKNINWVNFSGTVGPRIGVNLRYSQRKADRSNRNEPYGKRLEFDAWTTGENITDIWLGTPDSRWFKVKGTNLWVPSAYILGNPPNLNPSSPNPGVPEDTTPENPSSNNKSGNLWGYYEIAHQGSIESGDDWDVGKGKEPAWRDVVAAGPFFTALTAAVSSGTLVKGGNPLVTQRYYDYFWLNKYAYSNLRLPASDPLSSEMHNHSSFRDRFQSTISKIRQTIDSVLRRQLKEGSLGNMSQFLSRLKESSIFEYELSGFTFDTGNLHVIINGVQKIEIGIGNFVVDYDPSKNKANWSAKLRYTVSDDFAFSKSDAERPGLVSLVLKPAYEIQKRGVARPYSISLIADEDISGSVLG